MQPKKSLKIASWNVNSLKVRLEHVQQWMSSSAVDVLALQETKLTDPDFPQQAFLDLGLHVVFSGQKTYNGVAIISREPLADIETDIPGFIDPQRRILAVTSHGIRIINLYVPNGSEVGSAKYIYKLSWLEHVTEYIKNQLAQYPKLVVLGDFNIAPNDCDVYSPTAMQGGILISQCERDAFSELLALGLIDGFRAINPELNRYSWWDYRAASFPRNQGARIDHILPSNLLGEKIIASDVDLEPRCWARPSDHAPIWMTFNL